MGLLSLLPGSLEGPCPWGSHLSLCTSRVQPVLLSTQNPLPFFPSPSQTLAELNPGKSCKGSPRIRRTTECNEVRELTKHSGHQVIMSAISLALLICIQAWKGSEQCPQSTKWGTGTQREERTCPKSHRLPSINPGFKTQVSWL